MEQALVNDIQGYSIHDGPGIRTTVFLKGCNLRCEWCQNPEGLVGTRQIGFIKTLCEGCGRCANACRYGAIRSGAGEHRIDYSLCIACGLCVDACIYHALVAYGEPMSAEQVFDKAKRDGFLYEASGGGVTLSGGEPLLHPDFAADLLSRLHDAGIHTAIETAGNVAWESFEKVVPATDLFLFDFKICDAQEHERATGVSNERIKANAKALVEAGAEVIFRMPLLKGVNDSEANIEATSAFLAGIGRPRLQLMPFHRMGQSKWEALGMEYPAAGVEVMSAEEIEGVRAAFEARGVECDVSK